MYNNVSYFIRTPLFSPYWFMKKQSYEENIFYAFNLKSISQNITISNVSPTKFLMQALFSKYTKKCASYYTNRKELLFLWLGVYNFSGHTSHYPGLISLGYLSKHNSIKRVYNIGFRLETYTYITTYHILYQFHLTIIFSPEAS